MNLITLMLGPATGRTLNVADDMDTVNVPVFCQPCAHAADQSPIVRTVTYRAVEGRPAHMWWADPDIAYLAWECHECQVQNLRDYFTKTEAALERVRELHPSVYWCCPDCDATDEPIMCDTCKTQAPCPTRQAIDGGEQE